MEAGQTAGIRTVVDEVVDAYNARDLDRLLAQFDERIEWKTTRGFLWPGSYRGRPALRGLFERWFEGWESGEAEPEEYEERGDHARLTACLRGRSAGDGLDVQVRLHWVFTVRGGRVTLVRSFETAEEARAAL